MLKRTLIAGIWFIALWSLGGATSVYLHIARPLLLIPTALGAITVWIGLAMYDLWRSSREINGHATHRVGISASLTPSHPALTHDLDT